MQEDLKADVPKFKLKAEDKKIIAKEKLPSPDKYIDFLLERGHEGHAEIYKKVIKISKKIEELGGRAFLVGGSVRDMVVGKVPKDYDLEIYGLEPEVIKEILEPIGKMNEVGKSFEVTKVFFPEFGLDIDVSLPRKDSKVAPGHKGFKIKYDKDMSITEAAKRRDFTINSVCADPLNGDLFDPYDGVKDLKNRVLRVTDAVLFKDDPLRVLRGIQFIGRYGLEVDKKTITILQETTPSVKELSKERIFEEWGKLLLKSEMPSLGLAAAMNLGILRELHPELPPLIETPQEPEWHPEGDVWIHTLMVIDAAAKIIHREGLYDNKAITIMLAALCHDLGKPSTTEEIEGKITSRKHEQAGVEPTKKFLAQIGVPNEIRDKVIKLVGEHLAPSTLYINEVVRGKHVSDGAINRLAERLHPGTIQELVMVSEADHMGRGNFDEPQIREQLLIDPESFQPGKWLLARARACEVENSKPAPLTLGRHWLTMGFKPSKNIGRLIHLSNELRDEKGFSREMIFESVDGIEDAEKAIEQLERILKL